MTSSVSSTDSAGSEILDIQKPAVSSPGIPMPLLELTETEGSSLTGRAQPIRSKELLKILLDQVRKDAAHSRELIQTLQEKKKDFPDSAKDFDEVISLLEEDFDTVSLKVDAVDEKDSDLLDTWVYVDEKMGQVAMPPKYQKTWTSYAVAAGGAVWYVTKVSGTVLYFLCDKVLLNGSVLKVAAATGSIVSVMNLVGSPALPVLQTVLFFVVRRVIGL